MRGAERVQAPVHMRMFSSTMALCTAMLVSCIAKMDSAPADHCAGPLGKPIPTSQIDSMTSCCQADMGKAHCLDASKVPSNIKQYVATCDSGGYCIPDNFLATGASEPPATCTAFGGPGVCLSRCIPQVSMNAGLLRADTCTGTDELCVPCTSPLNNMPTHACDLLQLAVCVGTNPQPGPSGACGDPNVCARDVATCGPVVDPSTLPSCGADAHCVDPSLVTDPTEAARLGKCTDGVKLCVPDLFIASGGKFVPKTCASVNGNEGRCLSTVLPEVTKEAALLPQDVCTANERCSPCFNPVDGTATGACNLSCDTGPTQAAKPFTQCCSARARCVDTTLVPAAEQKSLSQQECTNAQLCVPDDLLLGSPIPTCTASSFILGDYTGVCLSDCLDFGIQGIALARGSCSNNYKCAPCTQNGQPTGAPGCPM
jgi:hypothetical protein